MAVRKRSAALRARWLSRSLPRKRRKWAERLEERLLLTVGFPEWTHLSTAFGDLETANAGNKMNAALVLDVDVDGVNDFVIAERSQSPSVTWFRRDQDGWTKHRIDNDILPIEAGGTFHDVDGDGDPDIVFGENGGPRMWWWENPAPNFDPAVNWSRRLVKNTPSSGHHDQQFGDVDGDGATELVSWNTSADALMLIEIPADPANHVGDWPRTVIGTVSGKPEGMAIADVDLDGVDDVVGAGHWFQHVSGTTFQKQVIDNGPGRETTRSAVGQLIPGGRPEVVMASGDLDGPLKWYEWDESGSTWIQHSLTEQVHGHTLELGDVNGDGNLDIFSAEMGQPGNGSNALALIFYGDGLGSFTQQIVSEGIGNHESRLADLDDDGDLDILSKPHSLGAPRIDIFLNNGWGRTEVDSDLPWRTIFVEHGDLNGDTYPDLITGGWWYQNPGPAGGGWTRHTIGAPLNNMATVFDFDGDGDLDIFGTQGIGNAANMDFAWARNDGAGNFTVLTNIQSGDGDFLQGVAVDRFGPSGTGPLEVALSTHIKNAGVQMLTVGSDPTNDLWVWALISTSSQGEALSSGDIDQDGDSDLLQGTQWLRNDQTGWTAISLSPDPEPDRNRLVDVNSDGRLDAVVGFESVDETMPVDLVWYEQPAGAPEDLWTKHVIATIRGPMSLDAADIDGDGDLDVVSGEHTKQTPEIGQLLVFENVDGAGSTWSPRLVYEGDEHHDGAQLVDTDLDGDLDIASIGWVNDKLVLYEDLAIASSSIAPSVSIRRGDANPTGDPVVTFDLQFTEAVLNVDSSDFEVVVTGTATGSLVSADDAGDGLPTTWRVTVGSVAGDGTLGLQIAAGNDIVDFDGNGLLAPPAVNESYQITGSPTLAITRQGVSPTNSDTVVFDLLFSSPVVNVDSSDFTLALAGVTGTIATVGGNGDSWSVTVDSITGSGTIGLQVSPGNDIEDASGDPLYLPPVSSEVFTVDTDSPTVQITRAGTNPTSADTLHFDLVFSEAVVNVDAADFQAALQGTLTIGGFSIGDAGDSDAATWTIAIDTVAGDGVLRVDVAGSHDILDLAGNPLTDSFATNALYLVDNSTPPARFFIADQTADDLFQYDTLGGLAESHPLAAGNNVSRGVAADPAGSTLWVVDSSNDNVYAYDPSGALLRSWKASGLTQPEGLAVYGVDLWIVDRGARRVNLFDGGAEFDNATVAPSSSFPLDAGNGSPRGITTDGSSLWVVNDSGTDAVFKYDLAGNLLGSWAIDTTNTTPRGITIDPVGLDDIWIVDSNKDRIFEYRSAAGLLNGSKAADQEFDLDPTNPFSQGIARTASYSPRLAILRAEAGPIVDGDAVFDLIFTTAVVNVDTTDFITASGGSSGTVATVDDGGDSDPTTFTVTVEAISGTGQLGIDLVPETDIQDAAGNPVNIVPLADEVYTVEGTSPTVVITRADPDPTAAPQLTFDLLFSEAVTNVDSSDFSVAVTGSVAAGGPLVVDDLGDGDPATFAVTISAVSGEGTLGLDLAAAHDIADTLGNPLQIVVAIDEVYTIDNTPPSVAVDVVVTSDTTPAITGTVDDPAAAVSVEVSGNSYAAVNNADGTWLLANGVIDPQLAEGTYDVIATATDDAGNAAVDLTSDELTVVAASTTRFFVADDAGDDMSEFDSSGAPIANYDLGNGNNAPRGAAADATGDFLWVIDNDDNVYVYDNTGSLLGSWSAAGLVAPEGIASDGVDIWIVDRSLDQVILFEAAAALRDGAAAPTSSFDLTTGNATPRGITTDGIHVWVVNDSSADTVFKYTVAGVLVGSWTIDAANTRPRGITIDPTNVNDIWVVDTAPERVYRYPAAAGRETGSQPASTFFDLGPAVKKPEGIADPPSGSGAQVTGRPSALPVVVIAAHESSPPLDVEPWRPGSPLDGPLSESSSWWFAPPIDVPDIIVFSAERGRTAPDAEIDRQSLDYLLSELGELPLPIWDE